MNNIDDHRFDDSSINKIDNIDALDFAKKLESVNNDIITATTNHNNKGIGNGDGDIDGDDDETLTTTTTTTTSNNKGGGNQRMINDEDYAAELQSEFNKEQHHNHNQPPLNHEIGMGAIQEDIYDPSLELPEIVGRMNSEDYYKYITLKRTGTVIKAVAMLILFFSIMSYFTEAWWLIFSGGLIFNPVGFYSAHYFHRRLFLFFMVYLCVDIIFRLGFLFSHLSSLNGFGIFLSLILDTMEGYMVYFSLVNFYKKMPRDGTITFREFFKHDNGLFSI